jgi:branched-chain amino acid aminotransferase
MADKKPKYLWWDGRQMPWDEATIHVTDIGWSTVGAIFEGIRAYWNPDHEEAYVFRLPEHMRRFEQSMKLVRLDQEYSNEQLIDVITELIRANDHREDVYIRPLAYRASGGGGGLSGFGAEASILINTRENPTHLLTGRKMDACVSSWTRISDNVMPPRIKNLSNYRNGQLANMEASINGYDIAILLNNQGKVAEGPGACIMVVRDGKLITPDVTASILESITRDAIIQMARDDLGLEVVERQVDRTELYIADEIFMCGTAFEITPVVSVDRYQVGDGEIGPITHELEKLFLDVLRGNDSRHEDWRTPVGLATMAKA